MKKEDDKMKDKVDTASDVDINTKEAKGKKKETKGETVRSLAIAIILAVIFRSFAFEPFYIPSSSMKSTLLIGDYVFVSKYTYGYSRYSFPFGFGIFEGRIGGDKPQRGDVAVFKLPTNPSINYIKRLVGMPGDKIQVINGELYINQEKVPRKKIENFLDKDERGNVTSIPQYIETLPGGVSYRVLDQRRNGDLDNTEVYEVPEGHYFMMGDNRDNSADSRVLLSVGYVPEENLVGPANRIFFSSEDSLLKIWTWPSSLRFSRFFSSIKYDGEK
ncbi:MAG: signal peptidase I [Rickettsiales bacterium]|nr:signal peptidase I [Pseudomonadota bacterium]MDA0966938.1 signal peptidase I [Pseudomonadota bacterium]MDG4543857.1 signal peptidase I [Rickettsiales bacterium]MDG4546003.1 signal peptidase I [Rickettsiales bacterium]MDG4548249.1 signal peptidase I [Rickettsiales bacterium]